MINVAILDDEAVYLDKEKEITEAYFREKQEDCRVDTFQSIEWFVSGLKAFQNQEDLNSATLL